MRRVRRWAAFISLGIAIYGAGAGLVERWRAAKEREANSIRHGVVIEKLNDIDRKLLIDRR